MTGKASEWRFIDEQGTFELINPLASSYLYFPLVNTAGIYSSITPTLNGDIKADHNTFLTLPVSVEDLHASHSARGFWVYVDGTGPWSVSGTSAAQTASRYGDNPEKVILQAGFLWHRITRENLDIGLRAEITNFIPSSDDRVELMKVRLTNLLDKPIRLTPTAAIPIYGRSADNQRDHRHVTSLLHRITCHPHGMAVTPTLSFDERGHAPNSTTYAVLGATADGEAPVGFFPVIEEFIGEGGSLDWPEAVVCSHVPRHHAGDAEEGYEAIGGLRFPVLSLQPGASQSYLLILAILNASDPLESLLRAYGSEAKFDHWLNQTRSQWKDDLDVLQFHTKESRFDLWLRWVTLQPILRRLFGNSFLPYHDYGKGGRGWRDLWQDILSLLLIEPPEQQYTINQLLFSNFAGVRLDGTNATIIGTHPGEFKADRNNLPRVWMDHGAWPLLTTRFYIDQTGDLAFLLRPQTYFKDHLSWRATKIDAEWQGAQGDLQRTASGDVYQGTILEHLLIQHLVAFYHVGEHNICLLEGADWNDGMDMARQRGESVAFSAFYAWNLSQLSELVLALKTHGHEEITLAREVLLLLDTLSEPIPYASPQARRARLEAYYKSCQHTISGEKVNMPVDQLAKDLAAKAEFMINHIRSQEWLRSLGGYAWFNGYYDNDGIRVEGDHPSGIWMTLTGQVFTLMGGIATDEQAQQIIQAADNYLYDPTVGGYRLNTNFGNVQLNLGRCFGFAYGHKENGAMFSHMAVMYANALYRRGFIQTGFKVLSEMYAHCQDFPTSRMYPGLPEYINPKGRGMYPYLTGSASWYLLTLVTEVFGVRGENGDLLLEPKLVMQQFDALGNASLNTQFAGRPIEVLYQNPAHLDYGEYQIQSIRVGELEMTGFSSEKVCILRHILLTEAPSSVLKIQVALGKKEKIV